MSTSAPASINQANVILALACGIMTGCYCKVAESFFFLQYQMCHTAKRLLKTFEVLFYYFIFSLSV